MPMPRPRARPRLTRMSTSSTSAFRQWNPRIYTFLVAGVVLLFVSISYLQMSLGGASSSHRPHHRSIKLDDPGMAISPVLTFNPFITFILVVDSSNSFQLTLCPGVKKNNLCKITSYHCLPKFTSQSILTLYTFKRPYVLRGPNRAEKAFKSRCMDSLCLFLRSCPCRTTPLSYSKTYTFHTSNEPPFGDLQEDRRMLCVTSHAV